MRHKNISTGEGGMIVTNDKEIADKIYTLRHMGETYRNGKTTAYFPRIGHGEIDYKTIGFNYRFDAFRSAIGIAQLKKLDHLNMIRMKYFDIYYSILKDAKGIQFYDRNIYGPSNQIPVLISSYSLREQLLRWASENNIPIWTYYPIPFHERGIFNEYHNSDNYNNATTFCKRHLLLYCNPNMQEASIVEIATALKKRIGSK